MKLLPKCFWLFGLFYSYFTSHSLNFHFLSENFHPKLFTSSVYWFWTQKFLYRFSIDSREKTEREICEMDSVTSDATWIYFKLSSFRILFFFVLSFLRGMNERENCKLNFSFGSKLFNNFIFQSTFKPSTFVSSQHWPPTSFHFSTWFHRLQQMWNC
jgi:hypothetical protein